MKKIFLEKIADRINQFGLLPALRQVCAVPFRFVRYKREDVILIKKINEDSSFMGNMHVKRLNKEVFADNKGRWNLPPEHRRWIWASLNAGSEGFMITHGGSLAAYGFVQRQGEYRFGWGGRFMIPEGFAVLRNLFVFREFRGRKLGLCINQARLASLKQGEIVVGFVIPENRYAIRNLKALGLESAVHITQTLWLDKYGHCKVTILDEGVDHGILDNITRNIKVR